MKQTLSVWMPNYNHSAYIGRAIEAIASQTLLPDELVIVDDASTDDSKAVIEGYRMKYPWIRSVYNTHNIGVLAIMNQAATVCRSDYLFLTSADDYILPGFFAAAMSAAAAYPTAGILFGQMQVEDETGKKLYTGKASSYTHSGFLSPVQYLERYMKQESPNHSLSAATIYRTKVLQDMNGFQEELGPWTDTFAIQAISLRYGAYYIAQEVAVWVVHSKSVSQGVRKNPWFMFNSIRKATVLMRSDYFREYFPEQYIRSWALKYRLTILLQYLGSIFGLSSVATNPTFQKWHQRILNRIA